MRRPYSQNVNLTEHLWDELARRIAARRERSSTRHGAHPGFVGSMEFHTAGDHLHADLEHTLVVRHREVTHTTEDHSLTVFVFLSFVTDVYYYYFPYYAYCVISASAPSHLFLIIP